MPPRMKIIHPGRFCVAVVLQRENKMAPAMPHVFAKIENYNAIM